MKTLSLVMPFFLLSAAGFSQTKKIAFESHSGNLENFNSILGNVLFDSEESGYGLPGYKSKYKIDSVIYLSDSTSLLVSKQYDAPFEAKADSLYQFVQSRKDTIYHNPLFTRKTSTDSIGKFLKGMSSMMSEYEPSNKTVFIGYLKSKPNPKQKARTEKQQEFIPLAIPGDPPNNNTPFDPALMLMLGVILLLSLIGGWFTWRFYKPKFQPA